MVRLALDVCVPNLMCPMDVYVGEKKKRLLVKKGTALNERIKELLSQNNVRFLDFPLPYETQSPPPYTFSEEMETALFCIIRDTYLAFKNDSVENPIDIRKQAYDLLTQAFQEFRQVAKTENSSDLKTLKRSPRSILHLRTVGALDDYLFEHAKNVSLFCVCMGFDYFRDCKQRLAEIHKVGLAGMFADIGMMRVPSRILKKNESLTEKELECVQKHPVTSAQFVDTLFRQKDFVTSKVVLHHHERCDGSGYPSKLRLNELEPYALLLSVVDSYTSMTSKRYFRPAKNPIEVMWTLNEAAGTSYEGKSVECLNYRVAPYPIGSVAKFANQRLVQIVDLENIALDFEKVHVLKKGLKHNPYNIPKSIRAFEPNRPIHKLKTVSIQGHIDKIGVTVDTYDLLTLYDYAKHSD